jgi:hypothetical protein
MIGEQMDSNRLDIPSLAFGGLAECLCSDLRANCSCGMARAVSTVEIHWRTITGFSHVA